MMKFFAVPALVFGTTLYAGAACAQSYPDKPINIVVTASVGGSIDALTRQLQPHWEATIGKTFNVENKEAASGVAGVRYFTSRPDDGYTIMICTEAHVSATLEKAPDVKLSLLEIINVHQFDPVSITVLAGKYKSFDELMAAAKAKPDSLTWGTPPTGSPAIIGKLLSRDFGMPLRYVPQNNGAATDTALLGGHIDLTLGGAASDASELGDKVVVLAHAAPQRLPYLPDVPTLNEIAAKNNLKALPVLGTARLLVVPATLKTKHPDRYKKIVESYKAAFHAPAYQEALKKTGQDKATQFMEPAAAADLAAKLFENAAKARAELGG
jgi:tripartite-type tricarboxylate transporter receptor subunit TctC